MSVSLFLAGTNELREKKETLSLALLLFGAFGFRLSTCGPAWKSPETTERTLATGFTVTSKSTLAPGSTVTAMVEVEEAEAAEKALCAGPAAAVAQVSMLGNTIEEAVSTAPMSVDDSAFDGEQEVTGDGNTNRDNEADEELEEMDSSNRAFAVSGGAMHLELG